MIGNDDLARSFLGYDDHRIAAMRGVADAAIRHTESFAPAVKLLRHIPGLSVFKTNDIVVDLLGVSVSEPIARRLGTIMLLVGAVYDLGRYIIIAYRDIPDPTSQAGVMDYPASDPHDDQNKQKPQKEHRVQEYDDHQKDRNDDIQNRPSLVGCLGFS